MMSLSGGDTPVVSIVTPTRNRADALRKALLSIKGQSFERFEAIIVDDGSVEATLKAYDDIWAELDERFRLHHPPLPGLPGTGPSAARNRALRLARGEFIAFLDDDDSWTRSDHLAVGVDALARTGADYFFADLRTLKAGRVVLPSWYARLPALRTAPRVMEKPAVHTVGLPTLLPLIRNSHIHLDATIVRRRLLDEVQGFEERIRYGEDYHLMVRLLSRSRGTLFRPECVADYVVSTNPSAGQVAKIEQALHMVFVTQHLQVTENDRGVRRAVRAREAWQYRQLAEVLLEQGRRGASRMAWQSLCVFPTFGGLGFLARTIGRSLGRRMRGQARQQPPALPAPSLPQSVPEVPTPVQ
jgi:GT2 family glycosyltransferase